MIREAGFDAVVMLTWSDWKTEPRSNRYHYATRFSREVPVLFVQPWANPGTPWLVEPTEIPGIDIVHGTSAPSVADVGWLKRLLEARGIRRPLFWIYNSLHFEALIDAFPRAFRVYHATEDYFTRSPGMAMEDHARVSNSVCVLLRQVDLVVAVSEGVRDTLAKHSGYDGRTLVLPNGCDAGFFRDCVARARDDGTYASRRNVVLYQGGINQRLDYPLLLSLVRLLPDWEFRFCGAARDLEGWNVLQAEPNVRWLGDLKPGAIAQAMCEATVGIIPFVQDAWIRNSLPLKAWEYVACGLPVVTMPIDALAGMPEVFAVATTAEGFAEAIRTAATTRVDGLALSRRDAGAESNSYDARFAALVAVLGDAHRALMSASRRYSIALLFDPYSMKVGTVAEHADAFRKYSGNDITFVACTNPHAVAPAGQKPLEVDLSCFDAVIVHYSVRLSLEWHLNEGFASAIEHFDGLKILFIQDEYDATERARRWLDRLGFDIVYTCVPPEGLGVVYPPYRFPSTEFLPTLTGYVPEMVGMERFAVPAGERGIRIAYRGRRLPAVYGALGQEKYRIGVVVKEAAIAQGIPVDIEVDDTRRIYGLDWYRFLGSAGATLGTESGSNVFDFDGSLQQRISELEAREPGIGFDEIAERVLQPHEGRVRMNRISPKIFEAIRLRTALLLVEGEYSGVVKPDVHFIPIRKDFSNLSEVFRKLEDRESVAAMTERAYRDVVTSGDYSYQRFVAAVDEDIRTRLLRARPRPVLVGALHRVLPDGSLKPVLPILPLTLPAGASPLESSLWTRELADRLPREAGVRADAVSAHVEVAQAIAAPPTPLLPLATVAAVPSPAFRMLRALWHCLPVRLRLGLVAWFRGWIRQADADAGDAGTGFRVARAVWRRVPSVIRVRAVRLLHRVRGS